MLRAAPPTTAPAHGLVVNTNEIPKFRISTSNTLPLAHYVWKGTTGTTGIAPYQLHPKKEKGSKK